MILRDRGWEREALQRIAGDMVNVGPLMMHAQRRADEGAEVYGFDFPDLSRNLEQEALDELADCTNYVLWRLDGLRRSLYDDDDPDRIANLHLALRGLAQVYEAVRKAQR